jgi:uncharacterized protein
MKPMLTTEPGWRVACRVEADAAAAVEERFKWNIGDDEPIPFRFRWEHVRQVVRTGLWLAEETGADLEIVEAAAWLHDVRKIDPDHGLAGALAAQDFLPTTDFPPAKIDAVVRAISQHVGLYRGSASRPLILEEHEGAAAPGGLPPNLGQGGEGGATPPPPLEPLEAAVLWDADKLTKLGVQALAYYLSGPRMDSLTLSERRQKAIEATDAILVRTVASMNTPLARRLAAQRLAEMQTALAAWTRDETIGRREISSEASREETR